MVRCSERWEDGLLQSKRLCDIFGSEFADFFLTIADRLFLRQWGTDLKHSTNHNITSASVEVH